MPRRRYSVHFEKRPNGWVRMTVPLLPKFEFTFRTFEQALKEAPDRLTKHLADLTRGGVPIPTETGFPICLSMEVEVPRARRRQPRIPPALNPR